MKPIQTSPLRAGYAQARIALPAGIEMTGFFSRQQPSIGVHDPVFVRAVVLDDGRTRVGIVACDLLGFSPWDDQKLRREIARASGVSADHLMIACTHTHSGPASMGLRGCGRVNAKWLRGLHRQVVQVVVKAARQIHPVTAHFGHHRADLGKVRWLPAMADLTAKSWQRRTVPRLPNISVLQFRRGARPLVNLVHYACHPVVMGSVSRKISADYPGAVTSFLQRKTGAPSLFLNGACGDLNPRVAGQPHGSEGFQRLREVGEEVGRSALQALRGARPLRDLKLGVTFQRVPVPLRIPSIPALRQTIRKHEQDLKRGFEKPVHHAVTSAFLDWAREAMAALKSGKVSRTAPVSLQQVRLGKLNLVALGGEPYDELGARICQRVGAPCLVVGYANGNLGYLPSREAFRHGGYEVEDAHKFYGGFELSSSVEARLLARIRKSRT